MVLSRNINTATWTKDETGEWVFMVRFGKGWKVPKPGKGLGSLQTVDVYKHGDAKPTLTEVRLISNVFARGGELLAYAERA